MDETVTITFLEGKNMRYIASKIAEKTNNTTNDVYKLLEDDEYISSLIDKYWFLTANIQEKSIYYPLEGYLYPDTYNFENKDVSVKTIFEKMLDKMEVYYFSPTGGTKKVSSIFADAMEKEVIWHDLGSKEPMMEKPEGEMTVVASPVFGGRIPSVVREKIEKFSGTGKKAVTIAVYGNRAYEDALLEMNDILTKCGFTVIASGAFVAQHSMAPEVGAGRPDGEDEKEIHKFAETVKNSTAVENVQVPGNRLYKPEMNLPVAPISLPSCTKCGKCVTVCPTNAISVADGAVITDIEKCILCMACTHICTEQARIRPLPLQQKTEQMLGALKGVRNKNEVFL